MDFLNNAIGKTKEFLDVAYKKAGDVVSTEKQKYDIMALKQKLEKDFAALGKLYFGSIDSVEGLPENVATVVMEICKKTEEIENMTDELNKAKNRKTCPSCGASVEMSSLFCNNCGEKFE